MKILIVSDAAAPQINGVVFTLENTAKMLRQFGHTVNFIGPSDFCVKVPLPSYPEIKLAVDVWSIGKKIADIAPDVIHIATEGTVGLAGRRYCIKHNLPFTTSYHTNFPKYVNLRAPWVSTKVVYSFFRWFHKPSKAVLVTTKSMEKELAGQGFNNLRVWGRGVDLDLFHSSKGKPPKLHTMLYVGRVSIEKNITAFLDLQRRFPFSSFVVVGDGPDRERLQGLYPTVKFAGAKRGDELATLFASASVFVFPSKSDTFGIVMIEANAAGLPVAAYPVTGPIDFVEEGVNGALGTDLGAAVLRCRDIESSVCRKHVEDNYSWEHCSRVFEETLKQVKGE